MMLRTHGSLCPPAPPSSGKPAVVAIADSDATERQALRSWLEAAGYRVVEHANAGALIDKGERPPAAICVDLDDDGRALELLRGLAAKEPSPAFVALAGSREIPTVIESGAYDFMTKPLDERRFVSAVKRATERWKLLRRVQRLNTALSERRSAALVGHSSALKELANQIDALASSDVHVCLSGEVGSGHELVARAIHSRSARRAGPFVAVSCANLPRALQDAELFGSANGATRPAPLRRGRFEIAESGTLFLDEIEELTDGVQAKLARTLERKRIVHPGSSEERPSDVRVICATHRDLGADVARGRFNSELYARLAEKTVIVPPLRACREDIPRLVAQLLDALRHDVSRDVRHISPEALDVLIRHDWPGNIAELENVLSRAMLACRRDEIALDDLPPRLRAPALAETARSAGVERAPEPDHGVVPLVELERRAIARALERTQGNVRLAAKLLGIGRATLYRRLGARSARAPQTGNGGDR